MPGKRYMPTDFFASHSDPDVERYEGKEVKENVDIVLERDMPPSVMDKEHVMLFLQPLIEPLVNESLKLRADLRLLVEDLFKSRVFEDVPVTLSLSTTYEVNYKERRFLYLYTNQQLTLVITGAGGSGTITANANVWTPITLPRGTKLTASNIPDAAPVSAIIRACDEPLAFYAALIAGANNIGNVGFTSDYPATATPLTADSGNQANATATATLAAVAGKTTYITGFEVTGAGATAALVVTVTVTGTVTSTLHYTYSAQLGVAVENTPLLVEFTHPIPASAPNTTIAVSCPALGAGNTNNTVVAHGYQL